MPKPKPSPIQPTPTGAERRRWARAAVDLPLTLTLPEGQLEARVRDVSRAGVCFFLERPIEPMTVLEVRFEVQTARGMQYIEGRGAVVRSQRIAQGVDHWEVAVFLHEISPKQGKALEEFVALRGAAAG